jgi:hypothetical protein
MVVQLETSGDSARTVADLLSLLDLRDKQVPPSFCTILLIALSPS